MSALFNWQKHSLSLVYNEAITLDEWATKRFWLHIFTKKIFTGKDWIVSSEAPPVFRGCQRRVDLMVQRAEDNHTEAPIVLWAEAKKSAAGDFNMGEVESQGYTAGMEHLMWDETGRTAVWNMTVFGPFARVWAYVDGEDFVLPIFPANFDFGNKNTYINLRGNEGIFEWIFDFIQNNIKPTAAFVQDITHGRVPGMLVDVDSAIEVIILKASERELVGRMPDGAVRGFPADWCPSVFIRGNIELQCFYYHEQIGRDITRYWTRSVTPSRS